MTAIGLPLAVYLWRRKVGRTEEVLRH